MSQNGLFMQRLADVLGIPILRPANAESTAFGAACLAGLGCGMYRSLEDIANLSRSDARFDPQLDARDRDAQVAGWRQALDRVRTAPT
jgi:glycerol kinase